MADIDDLTKTVSAIGKVTEPVIMEEEKDTSKNKPGSNDDGDDSDGSDYEMLELDDPQVLVFLSGGETQGLMNADFLEFFTI